MRDDLVEVVQRDQQAFEDVGAALLLGQLELGPPDDDLALVADVGLDRLAQRQRPGHAVDERDHVDAERRLHRRVLVELVEHDLGDGVALELDDQAHPALVGVVLDVGDPVELLLLDQVGDLLDEPAVAALLDHVGQLGDHDGLLALLERLDVRAGLEPHAPATAGVGLADPGHPEDDSAGREVGALDVLHQPLDVDVGVLDEGGDGPDRLAQVVRGDVRRHADGDSGRAVDEQVGEARRQDERLLLGVVVVGREVDRVRVEVAEHLGGDAREAGLRVAHGRRGIVVDRAEVALAVDQRVAHREVLREADQGVVDRRVAVRVVLAHDLADDEGALAERAVGLEAVLVHREQHAAMDRLEAVARVGQGPPHDDRHRVVEVGRLHLLLEPARLDVAAAQGLHGHLAHPLPRHRGW